MADVNIRINAEDKASGSIGKAASSLDGLKGAAEAAATAFGVYKAAQLVESSTLMAARNETLAVVLHKVGENAGYSASQMDGYAQGVAKMGITVEQSRLSVTRMAQANLDLSKSTDLARLSQDAAVIAGMNSSQALDGIMHGITTLQPEILRTYGIVINQDQAWQKWATSMGRTVEQMTQGEKQQATMNAVLAAAPQLAGVYEASLGTVGKALYSLKRYIDDNKAAFGEMFTPALKVIVDTFTQSLKDLGAWFVDHKTEVKDFAKTLADDVKKGMDLVKDGAKLVADHLDLVKGAAVAAGIAIAGVATAAALSSIGSLITKFIELRAVILAAAAANVSMAGTSVSTLAGTAAGLSKAGIAGLAVGAAATGWWAGSKISEMFNLNGEKDQARADQDLINATRIYDAVSEKLKKKEEDEKSEAAAEAGRQAQEERKRQDAAFLQQQMDKKTMEARLKLAEETDKFETEKIKARNELELDLLKDRFDQGKVTAQDYYNKINEMAYQSAVKEMDALNRQITRIGEEMGKATTTPEAKIKLQTDLIQIDEKALAINTKLQKTYQDSNASQIKDLKTIRDLRNDTESARSASMGQYLKSSDLELKKEKESIDFLKIKTAAEAGNADAIAILKDKEISWRLKNIDAMKKEADFNANIYNANDQIIINDLKRKGLEDEAFQLQKKIDLRNLENKIMSQTYEWQNQMNNAIATENFQLIDQLNTVQRINEETNIALRNEISDRQYSSGANSASIVSGGSPGGFINSNIFPSGLNSPFLGGYATGTNYVPSDGYAFLHEGEAVIPKSMNKGGVNVNPGAIVISLPNVTKVTEADADQIARMIFPKIKQYAAMSV